MSVKAPCPIHACSPMHLLSRPPSLPAPLHPPPIENFCRCKVPPRVTVYTCPPSFGSQPPMITPAGREGREGGREGGREEETQGDMWVKSQVSIELAFLPLPQDIKMRAYTLFYTSRFRTIPLRPPSLSPSPIKLSLFR